MRVKNISSCVVRTVVPAEAGIQYIEMNWIPLELAPLDSRFRGNDKRGGNDGKAGAGMTYAIRITQCAFFACLLLCFSLGNAGEAKKQEIAAIAQTATKQASYLSKGAPTKAIQELDGMLDDFHIGTKLTRRQEEENRELKRKIIHGTFDIRELSKLALARHWNDISTEEQDRFVKLLTDLLEEKALFSKEQIAAKSKTAKKYRVVYRGDKFLNPNRTIAFTRTKVIIPSENIDITLNYKLKRQDGVWKIFDVIVDEASLVDNYRYQFDSIIKKHGYADLVRRMSGKLEEVKAKRRNNG